jgi:hypothetical protein
LSIFVRGKDQLLNSFLWLFLCKLITLELPFLKPDMRRLWLAWLVIFACGFASTAEAQMSRKQVRKNNKNISGFRGQKSRFSKELRYNSLGFSVNALNYYGDLSPRPQRFSTDITFTKPGFGLSFQHRFGPRYTFSSQFMWGILKGSDAESADPLDQSNGIYRYKRNLSFRNQISELSAVGVVDLFSNRGNYITRAAWTPYIFVGVAGVLHSPQALAPATDLNGAPLPQAGEWVKLRELGTEGQRSTLQSTDVNFGIKPYSGVVVAIPFGLGARLRLTEILDIAADIGFRYTFTDYLDDVSQNYVDLGVLSSELARAMSYRTGEMNLGPANESSYVARNGVTYTTENGYGREYPDNMRGSKNDKDVYMVTSIRITYIIGATFHRAKFR